MPSASGAGDLDFKELVEFGFAETQELSRAGHNVSEASDFKQLFGPTWKGNNTNGREKNNRGSHVQDVLVCWGYPGV